jgi:hypothetical protein
MATQRRIVNSEKTAIDRDETSATKSDVTPAVAPYASLHVNAPRT